MSVSNLIYRLKQKWRYHTARNSFEKKVAEINRNTQIVRLEDSIFSINDCKLKFSCKHHSFIIDRVDLFISLLKSKGEFTLDSNDLIYIIDKVKLRIKTAEEIYIIHEIFFEGCYAISTNSNYNVIDVGMNVGYASLFFASDQHVEHVYSYEPFTPTFLDAQVNLLLNPVLSKKITTFNFGLSREFEKRVLPYSPHLKGKNSMHNEGIGSEEIQLRKAKDVIEEIISKKPLELYFIKMDCEGAEFDIFEDLRRGNIPEQIFGFIIEWHKRTPQLIIDTLLSNNFKLQKRGSSDIGIITAFR